MDMSDSKVSDNFGFMYSFVFLDNFSKYTWFIPIKNKYGQTITDDFSKTTLYQNEDQVNWNLIGAKIFRILFFKTS